MMSRNLRSEKRHRAWAFTSALAGLLLLSAAALKLVATPARSDSLLPFAAASSLVILIELIFALWLLSGRFAPGARLLAAATFATFAAVSSVRAWSGDGSCGCFGIVAVPPALMATVDSAVLCLLLVARPPDAGSRAFGPAKLAGVVAALVLLAAVAQLSRLPTALADKEYEPRPGQKWPLVDELEGTIDIGHGESCIVLYRPDCQHCRKFLSDLVESESHLHRRVVLVEIQPPDVKWNAAAAAERVWSFPMLPWVATPRDVPIRTPAVVLMRDGAVVAVRSPAAEESAATTLASLVSSPDLL